MLELLGASFSQAFGALPKLRVSFTFRKWISGNVPWDGNCSESKRITGGVLFTIALLRRHATPALSRTTAPIPMRDAAWRLVWTHGSNRNSADSTGESLLRCYSWRRSYSWPRRSGMRNLVNWSSLFACWFQYVIAETKLFSSFLERQNDA